MGNKIVRRDVQYANGNYYSGEMKGEKRHGQGTYTWGDDGTSYTGSWVNNEQNGYGVTTFKNGNKYSGQFFRNNIEGQGRMETLNEEVIEGHWSFQGRANNVPNSYNQPVAKYLLNVSVKSKDGLIVDYKGPATLHLKSGMVVLPNMQDPNQSVYAAVVVSDAEGEKKNFAVSEAEVVEAEPVNQGIAPGSVSVAYGAQDSALEKTEPKPKPINPLDPRNYF